MDKKRTHDADENQDPSLREQLRRVAGLSEAELAQVKGGLTRTTRPVTPIAIKPA